MLKDEESRLKSLRWDYELLREQRAAAKQQIERSHKDQIARELEASLEKVDREFASKLFQQVSDGVRISKIRSDVLRTNTWSVWEKWRNRAGLQIRTRRLSESEEF